MKKANSVLYLAPGMAARKTISDKFPTVNTARNTLVDLIKTCKDCFEKPKNETLDRFKFLRRTQNEQETLRQFWNALNDLATKYNFGNITESLVKDVLIVNMSNKDVQQKLCTEPKATIADTIQFAISYKEGAMRQQPFDNLDKPNIKAEPSEINNINVGVKRWGQVKNTFDVKPYLTHNILKNAKRWESRVWIVERRVTSRSFANQKALEFSRKVETLPKQQHKETKE